MTGHIIIVTEPGGAIDEGVMVILEKEKPKLYQSIVDLASVELADKQITFSWPTDTKIVTQGFGINPQHYKQWNLPGHEGIDMRAPMGAAVYAAWGGKVVRNEFHKAYGNSVRIEAKIAGETYEFVYAHLLHPAMPKVGEIVTQNQIIGHADSTGNSTGSHLHFSLKKRGATESGETDYPYDLINPEPFFKETR